MMSKTTVRMIDIAHKAGVSLATVGRVLQGTGANNIRVGEKTASRVKNIAEKLNYRPNLAARQLAGKRSHTIGVLLDPMPIPSNSIRLAEISRQARELGYHTIILHEQPQPKLVEDCLDEFASRGIDGLICVHHFYPGQPALVPEIVNNSDVQNVVFIDQPQLTNASFIGLDFADVSRQSVQHLLDRGHKRIGFAVGSLEWYSGSKLHRGYLEALKSQGLNMNGDLSWIGTERKRVNPDLHHITRETANRIIDDLIIRCEADALISDDQWAAQLLNCLIDRGYRVPDDVAVAGNGNLEVGEYTRPRLTTVDLQYEVIARGAVDMLIEMIEDQSGEKSHQGIFIKPRMVIREST